MTCRPEFGLRLRNRFDCLVGSHWAIQMGQKSQSPHVFPEVCLVLSLWKESINDLVPLWVKGDFWILQDILPTESPISLHIQAGELLAVPAHWWLIKFVIPTLGRHHGRIWNLRSKVSGLGILLWAASPSTSIFISTIQLCENDKWLSCVFFFLFFHPRAS